MKDVGKDHKMIVDRLASTLDGLRRTFDPAWDVMRDKEGDSKDPNVEILIPDAGSITGSPSSREATGTHPGTFTSSLSTMTCHFWGRVVVLYLSLFVMVLILDWYFVYRHRPKPSRVGRGGQPSLPTPPWTRTALRYAVLCLLIVGLFTGGLLYKIQIATIPHHLFRTKG